VERKFNNLSFDDYFGLFNKEAKKATFSCQKQSEQVMFIQCLLK
jgi:hypothetical protein